VVDARSSINLAIASELHDALVCLKRAHDKAQHFIGPERQALFRELIAAEMSLSRALVLVGEG
jgi:hypothetical protein